MSTKRRVSVKREREVLTYEILLQTSYCLLKKGKEDPKGRFHQFMASLVFTVFALEAYLNHVGAIIFKCWDDLEKLAPKQKLNVIADRLGVKVEYGKRPWQTIELFKFRSNIAHGKSIKIEDNKILSIDDYSEYQEYELLLTNWEKLCTQKNVEKAREDVKAIVKKINTAAGFKSDHPCSGGFQFVETSVITD
ncbi:MAG: hypothetical protein JXB42_04405 [Deltaproteobacteria bacterium]|nr:hypothetical protein [Deltaproteobacteria bacterium]